MNHLASSFTTLFTLLGSHLPEEQAVKRTATDRASSMCQAHGYTEITIIIAASTKCILWAWLEKLEELFLCYHS